LVKRKTYCGGGEKKQDVILKGEEVEGLRQKSKAGEVQKENMIGRPQTKLKEGVKKKAFHPPEGLRY